MLEGTSKPFEEQFNSWYKKFLTEESSMNKEIKEAKDYKQKKLEQSRAEAKATLKNYEAQQREKLEREKDKINVEKNVFDKMDADFQKEVENMKLKHRQNKDVVIKMLIDNIFNVDLNLPPSILAKNEELNRTFDESEFQVIYCPVHGKQYVRKKKIKKYN